MGFSDAVTGRLFLERRKSDLEFQIQAIMERKLAILDQTNKISAQLSKTIFQTDQNDTITYICGATSAGISSGTALPGDVYPAIQGIGVPQTAIGSNVYEAKIAQLQTIEKELDTRQKRMETELDAVKAEEDSMKKVSNDHAKKDFKIG